MIGPVLLSAALAGALFWATFFGRGNQWPLARYRMFSRPETPATTRVIRCAFEGADGSLAWWEPRYEAYKRDFGFAYQELWGAGSPPPIVLTEERRSLLDHTVRLALEEGGEEADFVALCAIERRVTGSAGTGFQVLDRTVLRVPLRALLPGAAGSVGS